MGDRHISLVIAVSCGALQDSMPRPPFKQDDKALSERRDSTLACDVDVPFDRCYGR